MSTPDDEACMRRAIEVARANLGLTAPNPVVGCVLVSKGEVIAEAATASGGRPHAEEQALAAAGEAARGAAAYVTLEPCGARSSGGLSCAQRLVEAGVARVVIACEDPSPYASGQGMEQLRAGGVSLTTGVLADEALFLAADFFAALGSSPVQRSETGEGDREAVEGASATTAPPPADA